MFNTFINDLRSNPRLRLWLVLIIGSIGLYALLLLRDALQNKEQQQRIAAQNISRLRAQLAQPEWLERLEPANTLAAQMEGRLWQAPTAGLAQAALQDWLQTNLQQAQATKPVITVTTFDEITAGTDGTVSTQPPTTGQDGSAPTPPDLWQIKAKVGFDFAAPSLLEFLSRIEANDKQIIVSALNVRKEPFAHVEVEILAYFQKQKQEPKPTQKLPQKP